MPDLFEGYDAGVAYDEMFDASSLREPYRRLIASLSHLSRADLVGRLETLQTSYLKAGQRAGFQNEAHRMIGRTRADLEYRPLADVITDLPAEMERLQHTCTWATEAITSRFFAGSEGTNWLGGRV